MLNTMHNRQNTYFFNSRPNSMIFHECQRTIIDAQEPEFGENNPDMHGGDAGCFTLYG